MMIFLEIFIRFFLFVGAIIVFVFLIVLYIVALSIRTAYLFLEFIIKPVEEIDDVFRNYLRSWFGIRIPDVERVLFILMKAPQ